MRKRTYKEDLKNRWKLMRYRCYNPNHQLYHNYGGRGIGMYPLWKNSFEMFYVWSINNGFKPELSIDRIDNDGNYEPSNCRWVDRFIQTTNTRKKKGSKNPHPGVYKIKGLIKNPYKVKISHNYKIKIIGYFPTLESAIEARTTELNKLIKQHTDEK